MKNLKQKISYGKNVYNHEEINAVVKTLKKTTQMSKNVLDFESKISKIFGYKYGVMVNSGTSAIMLCLKLLNLKPNDEIIVPCLNFATPVSSILFFNLKPILVDININTLQIDEEKISKKINKKTRAIMVPNLIGNVPKWNLIKKIAKKNKLIIIEDSADTIAPRINDLPTGKYTDFGITSFYGSHVISCAGNGGMLMLKKKSHYEKARLIRSWGRLSSVVSDSENINKRLNIKISGYEYDRKYTFGDLGFNFEPSEIGASFGLVQLKKFRSFEKKRINNFNSHLKFFKKYKKYFILPKINNNVKTNFLAYPIIIKENKFFKRKELQIFLEKNNVQTRPIFSGNLLRHPAFKCIINSKNKIKSFPNSDYIMRNGILVGCHQGLAKKQINSIQRIIVKFMSTHCE
jgi:CDP-4-dehydro-6-deoxyglucose reductase, E1